MDEPRGAADGQESPPESAGAAAPVQSRGASAQRNWQANDAFMKVLMAMGISRNAAEKALFYTGNRSPDVAAAWIFENPDADLETPIDVDADEESDDGGGVLAELYKMVFVVNTELDMGTGKIAAQVAHATLGIHRLLLQDENKYGSMLLQWEEYGETKIVLKGNNTQQLVELEKKALKINLPTYLVQDAGKTQIPAGSTTVLCIMGRLDLIDQVTGCLKLL